MLRTIDDRPAWRPDEALTVEQAIVASTVTPAWLAGDERRRGRLLPGFLADLVVLSRDPVHLPADELESVEVVATMVGGRWVFQPPPGIEGSPPDPLRNRGYDPVCGYTHDAPGPPVRDLLGRGLRGDRRREMDGPASSTTSPRAPRRFTQIEHSCAGISPRTLAERLRWLEAEEIVVRRSYAESPPRVEYELTDKGRGPPPAHHRDAPLRPRMARLRRARPLSRAARASVDSAGVRLGPDPDELDDRRRRRRHVLHARPLAQRVVVLARR